MEHRKPNLAPSFALSYCFAPKFCPIKVVSPKAKQVIGKNAKPSIFEYEPLPATATDEKSVKFTEAYKAKFPDADAPIQFAADAYDCVYAIKAALEKAGVNDASIDSKELCDKLKAAMVEIEYDGITGNSKWTTDGEVTKDPKIMQIKVTDGKGVLTDIG